MSFQQLSLVSDSNKTNQDDIINVTDVDESMSDMALRTSLSTDNLLQTEETPLVQESMSIKNRCVTWLNSNSLLVFNISIGGLGVTGLILGITGNVLNNDPMLNSGCYLLAASVLSASIGKACL